MMKKLLTFLLAVIAFAACTNNDVEEATTSRKQISDKIHVGFEREIDETRVQLDGEGRTVWTEDDRISVFYYSTNNLQWAFQGKTGDRSGSFAHVSGEIGSQNLSDIIVAYPYQSDLELYPNESQIRFNLATSQNYLEDSYDVSGNVMVACGQSRNFMLRSVCGWVKVQLTGENKAVRGLLLLGNDGEQVTGDAYVDYKTMTTLCAAESDHYSYADMVHEDVYINCEPAVWLDSEEPTAFYFALLPQEFEKGITVTVEFSDGSSLELVREEPLTVNRNHIVPMGVVSTDEKEEIVVENNQIVLALADGEEFDYTTMDLSAFDVDLTAIDYLTTDYACRLTFSGDITHIGDFAFDGCNAIKEAYLPDSLKTMGVGVFAMCPNLSAIHSKYSTSDKRAVVIDDTLVAFASADVADYTINFAKHVGDYSFVGCTELIDVTFSDGVETIGAWSFRDCLNLETAYFGNDVQTIGEGAFYNCPKITFYGKFSTSGGDSNNIQDGDGNFAGVVTPPADGNVNLGNSTGVVEGAMQNSVSVTRLTIPESVKSISAWAFDGCVNLTTVICEPMVPPTAIFSDGVWAAFDNNAEGRKFYVPAESVEAYKTAEGWSDYAEWIFPLGDAPVEVPETQKIYYKSYEPLTPVVDWNYETFGANIVSHVYDAVTGSGVITFDAEVTTIGYSAFYGQSGLTEITIPQSVTSIGAMAFQECLSLQNIELHDNLEMIGMQAFAFCESITSITFPEKLEYIDWFLCASCTSLSSVTLGSNVKEIGVGAFENTALRSFTVPESVETIASQVFNLCYELEAFYGKGASADNRCIVFDGELLCFAGAGLTSYTLPSSVVNLGNGLTSLELEEVTIPDSVLELPVYNPFNCYNLRKFNGKFAGDGGKCLIDGDRLVAFAPMCDVTEYSVPEGVEVIGEGAFQYCNNLTSVILPDSVASILYFSFGGCHNLNYIDLGNTIYYIGDNAFALCTSLTEIDIPESVQTIDNAAFFECIQLEKVYCRSITPPILGLNTFQYCNHIPQIYVPAESVGAYKSTAYWRDFAPYIVGYDFESGEIVDGEFEPTEAAKRWIGEWVVSTNEVFDWYSWSVLNEVVEYDITITASQVAADYVDVYGLSKTLPEVASTCRVDDNGNLYLMNKCGTNFELYGYTVLWLGINTQYQFSNYSDYVFILSVDENGYVNSESNIINNNPFILYDVFARSNQGDVSYFNDQQPSLLMSAATWTKVKDTPTVSRATLRKAAVQALESRISISNTELREAK